MNWPDQQPASLGGAARKAALGAMAVCIVLGSAWSSAHGLRSSDQWWLLAGTALVVTSNWATVTGFSSGVGVTTMWNIRSAVHIFLLVVAGPFVAIASALLGSVVADVIQRRPWTSFASNVTCDGIAVWAGALALTTVGGAAPSLAAGSIYLEFVAACAAYVVASVGVYLLTGLLISDNPRRTLANEIDLVGFNFHTSAAEAILGASTAVVYLYNPWSLPLVLPLALSLFLVVSRGAEMARVTERALETMAKVVDERDHYTFEHSDRVCRYAMLIGEEMELSDRRLGRLYWTSRLHDLGKVAVDNCILNKRNSLTAEEFEIIKRHPDTSARILNSFTFDDYDTDVVACHHERYDGRGYLLRSAETVPLESFIIAVADAFDAMTSDRTYRGAMSHEKAIQEIRDNIETQFHPVPAAAFLRVYDRLAPLGSDGPFAVVNEPKAVPAEASATVQRAA